MTERCRLRVLALLVALGLASGSQAADPSPAGKEPRARKGFVATGPSSEAELARLRAALGRVAGVLRVDIRPHPGGAIVLIEGESSSLLSAAARKAGFVLRPTPTRSFAATGPTGESDRQRLTEALSALESLERVEIGPHAEGAALRLTGVAPFQEIAAAARKAGFKLRQLGSYVAAGPSEPAGLQRLRAALEKAPGVEEVRIHGLEGGATLLIYGPVVDADLTAAGKAAGFEVWPLGPGATPRRFTIGGGDRTRLAEALKGVEDIGRVELREEPGAQRLVIHGGRARPDAVIRAARAAGVELSLLPEPVTLPNADPEAGRGTPPDFDERVLEDVAAPGAPAPDFALVGADGVSTVRLSDFQGKRPVVLLFGSCT